MLSGKPNRSAGIASFLSLLLSLWAAPGAAAGTSTFAVYRPTVRLGTAGLPPGANAVAFGGDAHALLTAVIFDR